MIRANVLGYLQHKPVTLRKTIFYYGDNLLGWLHHAHLFIETDGHILLINGNK